MLSTICLGLKLVTRLPLILRGATCPENQGATPGKNLHSMQYVRDKGPIPVGRYEIGAPFKHSHTGPFSMRLNPVAGTSLGGRSGFMIHGDSERDPGNASKGCIVVEKKTRKKIWNSGDRWLTVEYP
ncbi:DUF2778 domain-containing protein [Paraburkholderia sp. MMS20-SJTR3]|uniref:DUF2778 domain-containing protein n=1 Tax=Paraburkholderia sejongensis TaxID=2886946 RepID=A0ABS8JS17_9BURK|nr:tlde1 domain-containing protein [Paraburkholderia sp. MMS20-SJTR3]MCC8392658.1 DUF2778 domain-containing protein [Paraburkholderia sp. MMS20-SJTR3]